MPTSIQPTVKDPHCLDFRRMPAGMTDPVHDPDAAERFACRDAARFNQCHTQCPKKACRRAEACLGGGAMFGDDACVSPLWTASAKLLALYLSAHAGNLRERHRAWDIARRFGADLAEAEPWYSDDELDRDAPRKGKRGA